ncbi:hypothetical protein A33M_0796 [Rhodovulum sp. PH10]|nr:hypothetical protein [Rhodovulum sp. PH10]EJW09919.1 hypothetical protein A33M_0796 [Rhodovulum sp. PH10]
MVSQRADFRRTPVLGPAALSRVVLDDHVRLPWRFFGRLTATILSALPA